MEHHKHEISTYVLEISSRNWKINCKNTRLCRHRSGAFISHVSQVTVMSCESGFNMKSLNFLLPVFIKWQIIGSFMCIAINFFFFYLQQWLQQIFTTNLITDINDNNVIINFRDEILQSYLFNN